MKWWDRLTGRTAEEGDDVSWRENVPADDEPESDEGGEDQQPDLLAELDDEAREAAEKYAASLVTAERQKARSALRKRGLDVTEDYETVIVEPGAAASWVGVPQQASPPAPAPAPQTPPAPAEDADEMPDPSYDAAGFAAWMRRRDEKREEKVRKEFEQRLDQIAQRQIQVEAQGVTVAQVQQALQAHNPALAAITEHPDFAATYQNALLSIDRNQWGDPRALAALAGYVAPWLDPAKQPQPQSRARDAQGRFTDDRAAIRAGRVQLSSSQEIGGGQPPRRYSESDHWGAQQLGVTMEEWDAWSQENADGKAGLALKAKQRARGGETRGRR